MSNNDLFQKAVLEQAKLLGMDPDGKDKPFLFIAEQSLKSTLENSAPLPSPWVVGGQQDGVQWYCNKETGESTWDHPAQAKLDEYWGGQLEKAKIMMELMTPGTRVEAQYRRQNKWFPGVIAKDYGNGIFAVNYDDGDQDPTLPFRFIRLLNKSKATPQQPASGGTGTNHHLSHPF
jgi:hypothetical protein